MSRWKSREQQAEKRIDETDSHNETDHIGNVLELRVLEVAALTDTLRKSIYNLSIHQDDR